jgi:F-type H+-transporting ATPase subunit delta
MQNPRLAARYAKSLIDLALERNELEAVYADVQYLQSVGKASPQFLSLMRSPVIKADKKQAILDAVTKGKVGPITEGFNRLLVNKGREDVIPEIINSFIDQYNRIKNINKVKLTTAQPLSEEAKNILLDKIKADAGMQNIQLETTVDESLIGGFVLEYNNNLVDASILRDLKDIRKQFAGNEFVMKIQ